MLQDLPVSASSRRLRVQAETQRRLTLNSILIPGPLFGSLVRLCWGRAMMFLPGVTRAANKSTVVCCDTTLLKVMRKEGGGESQVPASTKSVKVKKTFPRSRKLQERVPNKLKTPQTVSA